MTCNIHHSFNRAIGFLAYMGFVILTCLVIVWKVAPKYGKKHLLVYISVCSLIGSLSVVATQGLGAAIVLNITKGTPQFNHWFIYVTMVFVVCTLITELNYLNKALNLFNTAMVTPVYYVIFTSSTLVASVILFQGFSASPLSIMTVVLGFFIICAGVILLQTSKTAAQSEAAKENGEHDDKNGLMFEDKGNLDPGPIGLRAVPFDSLRQMVRASTMPNVPIGVHEASQNDHPSRRNQHHSGLDSTHTHLQDVVVVPQKMEGPEKDAVPMYSPPEREYQDGKAEFSEKHQVPVSTTTTAPTIPNEENPTP